jgi:hypothetical protein
MNDPNTILIVTDPDLDAECSELARAIAPLVLQDLQLGVPAEDTPHGRALVASVYRAVDQLEGQGKRSDRIAMQLLEALSRYEHALGQLLIESDEKPVGYVRDGSCADCGRFGQLQCITDQEQDNHPHLVCLDGCTPAPLYRIQWCIWVDGFDAEQQDWRNSEHEYTDEYEANTMRERCDEQFKTINIRHRVVEAKA